MLDIAGLVASRSALTFEHTYGLRDEEVNRRDASTKMQELCRVTATDIRPEVPQMFSELVYILKNSNFRSLQALYRQLKTGQICGKNSRIGKSVNPSHPLIPLRLLTLTHSSP